MHSRHILISGGAGFIGGHVARLALAAGHEVTILDNLSPQVHGDDASYTAPEGARFVRGDVTVADDWRRTLPGADTIVHLAADTGTGQSMYEIDRYYRVNVQGTATIADLLANSDHQVRNFVLASSRSVYGEGAYLCKACDPSGRRCYPSPRSPEQLRSQDWSLSCPDCGAPVEPTATREDDRLCPASIYAATKRGQEDLVRIACGSLGIAHSILRFQNVYGEGQSLQNPYTGILSIFSTRLRLGQPIEVFEDGLETRDFIHVDDVAAAIVHSVERPAVETLNVGSGEPVTVLALAELLGRVMGSTMAPVISGRYRVGDIRHNFADTSRFSQVTGLAPRVSLESGIERFCRWVVDQPIPEDLLDQANAELAARDLLG